MPWSQGRQEEVGSIWKDSWELEEQDVQLPRPLSTAKSREVWSGVNSSVERDELKGRPANPRAKTEELSNEKQSTEITTSNMAHYASSCSKKPDIKTRNIQNVKS